MDYFLKGVDDWTIASPIHMIGGSRTQAMLPKGGYRFCIGVQELQVIVVG